MQSDEVLDTPVARRSDSTTFMVAHDSDRIPPQPNFTGTSPASHGRASDAEASIRSQMATVSPLALLGGPNTTLTDPAIEVALELLVQFLTTAQDEQLAPDECIAFVPASRYAALLAAAKTTLASIQRHAAPPIPSPARSPAPQGPSHPKNPLSKDWAFDGTHCAALGHDAVPIQYWLARLLAELEGQGFTCDAHGVTQGFFMRQLLRSPLSEQLWPKIELLPQVRAAVASGTATLREHYALALVTCCGPEEALKVYSAATNPLRQPREPLNLATFRVEHQWHAAAALHCEPNPAGRFWALFSVLTPAERQLFTNMTGIQARLVASLGESLEAATARHSALLDDLLVFARNQRTTSPAGGGAPRSGVGGGSGGSGSGGGGGSSSSGGGGGGSGGGGGGGGGRGRGGARSGRGGAWGSRPSTPRPASAASAALSDAASSDSDDPDGPPASAAPAAGASDSAWNYTGNRANDTIETARRRTGHLCLRCLPGGPINRLPCSLHPPGPPREHRSSAPRCFPYMD